MRIVYSDHAKKRMGQRGITELEVEYVLKYPQYIKKSFEGRKEALGIIKNRTIKVEFVDIENYIRIITAI
ncbi:MAG: DUF4258 domain-containing protein [Nanoarchaeota archaeon]|nr:DUF4258 domain-containing protein [Nanoarchaeota archaeon]